MPKSISDKDYWLLIYLPFQVVPHITDEIQDWIERVAIKPVDGKEGPPDVCVIELGGTIGKQNNFTCSTKLQCHILQAYMWKYVV